ncbi:MAG: hypothetical protein ACRELD_09130 [Longimicrobiales bacterium]
MTDPTWEEATGGGHFAYFMVRVHVDAPGKSATCAGVVERLGTGRKCSFPDGQALLRLLADWSHAPFKMPPGEARSNEPTHRGA